MRFHNKTTVALIALAVIFAVAGWVMMVFDRPMGLFACTYAGMFTLTAVVVGSIGVAAEKIIDELTRKE